MQTKLFNPHYKPETAAQCTIINFIVTEAGLEDQLLAMVVRVEKPDLEQTKEELVNKQRSRVQESLYEVVVASMRSIWDTRTINAMPQSFPEAKLVIDSKDIASLLRKAQTASGTDPCNSVPPS